MVTVTMVDGIGMAMALLTGGVIGLLLTAAHYHRAAARQRRYEREIAQDAELRAVAQATLQRYQPTGSGNRKVTAAP